MNKKGDLSIGIYMIGLFLILFWLCFPFGMKMLSSDNYSEMSVETYGDVSNSSSGITGFIDGLKVWFKYLIMDIPGIPSSLKFIVYFFQLISLLFILGLLLSIVVTLRSVLPF